MSRWWAATVAASSFLVMANGVAADEAHFRLPTALAARVETGVRSGLSVGVEPRQDYALVTVSQAIRPFSRDVKLPLDDQAASGDSDALHVPPGFTLPLELGRRVTARSSALDVLHDVVAHVSRHIRLDDLDAGPQDAASVLRRGRGRCSGRANLAVGLLRVAGIPSRTVHGVVVERAGARWHRWGEAWLGELGWVPFDPGTSVGAVSVRYLPMAGASEHPRRPDIRLHALDETAFSGLPRRDGLRVVPSGGVTLRCTALDPAEEFTVVLIHSGGGRWFKHGRGAVVFAPIMPGRYRLLWAGSSGGGAMEMDLAAGMSHVSLRPREGMS